MPLRVSVTDGIIRIHGLADVMQGEMIELPGSRYAGSQWAIFQYWHRICSCPGSR